MIILKYKKKNQVWLSVSQKGKILFINSVLHPLICCASCPLLSKQHTEHPCKLIPHLLFALLWSLPGLLRTHLLWVQCVWMPKWWCWERRVWGRPAWWRDTFIIAFWWARTRMWVSSVRLLISMSARCWFPPRLLPGWKAVFIYLAAGRLF